MTDRVVAAAAALSLSPLIAARAVVAYATTGRLLDRHYRLGRRAEVITIRSFAGTAPGRRLAYLAAVVSCDLRIIGPRPLHPLDSTGRRCRDHDVTPGLLSPQRLQARTGIDYDPETHEVDQCVYRRANLGLMARYIVAEFLGGGHRPVPDRLRILGVDVANTTMEKTLDWVCDRSREARGARTQVLAFVNPDCLNRAVEDPEYQEILRRADRVLPDGIGLKFAARIQGLDVRENINGTDMFPRLCQRATRSGTSLFLLGAQRGVAAAAAEQMRRRYPGLRIAGVRDGYFTPEESDDVVAQVNTSGADILLVAMGVPRQEKWLQRHRADLRVGVAMGVGGLFDFYSGRIPRAPQWVREIGLEWAWRLAQEPQRMWRRYLVGNPVFLRRAWQEARTRPARSPDAAGRPRLLGYNFGYDEAAAV